MYLKKISLVNFKNYSQADFSFSQKINCFIGSNGVGKTNLLDAIYYLSFTKSFLNNSDKQNVKHGENFFVVQGFYDLKKQPEEIYCAYKINQKKKIKRNNKEYERLSEHIGLLPLVVISPNDIKLIVEGSEERRKFIDSVISQYDKEYLHNLLRYNKTLLQRNTLLKDFNKKRFFDSTMLEIYDDQLILYGQKIHKKRCEFIKELEGIFQKYYEFISLGREKVCLNYQSQLHNTDLKKLLTDSLERDLFLLYTSKGIHRDDLELKLGDFLIKKIGSQGQQKTYLAALKMAQFDFLQQINRLKPLLLLDDIFDKFDSQRVAQIIKLVSDEQFGQIFITDTNENRLTRIIDEILQEHRLFKIENDKIEYS